MDNTTDTLTIPHDLYARIAAYASSHGESLDSLVVAWLRERLSQINQPQEESTAIQARLEAIASLDGIVSAPVEREWADQHDLAVADGVAEGDQGDGHSA